MPRQRQTGGSEVVVEAYLASLENIEIKCFPRCFREMGIRLMEDEEKVDLESTYGS